MDFIDLRSDTITQPVTEMRRHMAEADVGDDVFGEDPTVNALQDKICELTGKEAALFVTSGTQANQIAINAHTQPGDEVICEYRSHIFNYEAGAPALLSGVQVHPIQGEHGILQPAQIEEVIRPRDHHFPVSRLIGLENTHNRWGGVIYPLEAIKEMRTFADNQNLLMHLDGARLWNASAATGIPIKTYASYFDSVSLCFSKGLGAPVGSVIAGNERFIERAHYYRKVYGGGMRQAGIIAAGALYALEHHTGRLMEDHIRARKLAEELNMLTGLVIDLQRVQTNIVIIDTSLSGIPANEFEALLSQNHVRMKAISPSRLRAVTHLQISDDDIKHTINAFKNILKHQHSLVD
ncbi:MAG: low-specificity L-threonine aldolase [Caldithrix sp.]|nr:low-specificity L-threonine aldolase [Caldithrix sp.]